MNYESRKLEIERSLHRFKNIVDIPEGLIVNINNHKSKIKKRLNEVGRPHSKNIKIKNRLKHITSEIYARYDAIIGRMNNLDAEYKKIEGDISKLTTSTNYFYLGINEVKEEIMNLESQLSFVENDIKEKTKIRNTSKRHLVGKLNKDIEKTVSKIISDDEAYYNNFLNEVSEELNIYEEVIIKLNNNYLKFEIEKRKDYLARIELEDRANNYLLELGDIVMGVLSENISSLVDKEIVSNYQEQPVTKLAPISHVPNMSWRQKSPV